MDLFRRISDLTKIRSQKKKECYTSGPAAGRFISDISPDIQIYSGQAGEVNPDLLKIWKRFEDEPI